MPPVDLAHRPGAALIDLVVKVDRQQRRTAAHPDFAAIGLVVSSVSASITSFQQWSSKSRAMPTSWFRFGEKTRKGENAQVITRHLAVRSPQDEAPQIVQRFGVPGASRTSFTLRNISRRRGGDIQPAFSLASACCQLIGGWCAKFVAVCD